jgi:uncharacterized OsmC-like protein
MTNVKTIDGQMQIINEAGIQVKGSRTPNSEGLSPRELLEASVALCVTITIQKVLERDQIEYDPTQLEVDVVATKEADPQANQFSHLHVKVRLPDSLDEAYRRKLITIAERGCTIGNTLKSGAVILTEQV